MELLEAIAMLRRLWVSLVYQIKVHEYKYHICGSRSEYGSDLGSNEHYLSSTENKDRKIFRVL